MELRYGQYRLNRWADWSCYDTDCNFSILSYNDIIHIGPKHAHTYKTHRTKKGGYELVYVAQDFFLPK